MENNELIFWVAYLPEGDKKKYLSDGQGHLRVFKTEEATREHIKPLLSEEDYTRVMVHEIEGRITVPMDEVKPDEPVIIHTLAPATMPTAMEMLASYKKRKGIE